jgi:hypothetical protein
MSRDSFTVGFHGTSVLQRALKMIMSKYFQR